MRLFRMFGRSREGSVVVVFALALVPLLCFAAVAIDYNRASTARARLQIAVDAATLNALHSWAKPDDVAKAEMIATINSLIDFPYEIGSFERDRTARTVRILARHAMPTLMLPIMNVPAITVAADSQVTFPQQTIQVAMVLDNSGSMAGARITKLIEAAKLLVDTLEPHQGDHKISYALVPFGQMVNVGNEHKNANWIDRHGQSPVHFAHLKHLADPSTANKQRSRLDIFESMDGAPWAGCVEARPGGYDVTDEPPSPARPETLFVPSFAPDEPGPASGNGSFKGMGIRNSYLDDDTGTCVLKAADLSLPDQQDRSCKYAGAKPKIVPSGASAGVPTGPNFQCTVPPLTRLTKDAAKLKNAVEQMKALGGTNISEGLAWGWRTLSRNGPFADGVPASVKHQRRIIVLMTDGENFLDSVSGFNKSWYGAWGYLADGRLTPPGSGSNPGREPMDAKLKQLCANAKADNIEIFTIGLDIPTTAAKQLLTACATGNQAHMITNPNDLVTVFKGIANQILVPYVSM